MQSFFKNRNAKQQFVTRIDPCLSHHSQGSKLLQLQCSSAKFMWLALDRKIEILGNNSEIGRFIIIRNEKDLHLGTL